MEKKCSVAMMKNDFVNAIRRNGFVNAITSEESFDDFVDDNNSSSVKVKVVNE